MRDMNVFAGDEKEQGDVYWDRVDERIREIQKHGRELQEWREERYEPIEHAHGDRCIGFAVVRGQAEVGELLLLLVQLLIRQ